MARPYEPLADSRTGTYGPTKPVPCSRFREHRQAPEGACLCTLLLHLDLGAGFLELLLLEGGDAAVVNASSRYALIALQGPEAQTVLQLLTAIDLSAIKYYWFTHGEVAGVRVTVSRTGYTGEDGFEIFVPPALADRVWTALLDAGRIEVIAGINLPMLIRLAGARKAMGVVEAVQAAQAAGRNYITVASEFLGHGETPKRKAAS